MSALLKVAAVVQCRAPAPQAVVQCRAPAPRKKLLPTPPAPASPSDTACTY